MARDSGITDVLRMCKKVSPNQGEAHRYRHGPVVSKACRTIACCKSLCSHLCTWPFLQFTLEEILGLAAAVEACSEHPLASAVLHFAAAHLAVAPGSFDAELSAGLKHLEGSSESSPFLGNSPSKAKRHCSPVATDWLQPAADIEVEEGECAVVLVLVLVHRCCLCVAGRLLLC